MKKYKRTKNNQLANELLYLGKQKANPTTIYLISYNKEKIKTTAVNSFSELTQLVANGPSKETKHWIHVTGLENTKTIGELCKALLIDFLTTQDILNSNHPTKIEEQENQLFIILKLFSLNEEDVLDKQQASFILQDNYLLTFTEKQSNLIQEAITGIENNVLSIRERNLDYLLVVLLNGAMANYSTHLLRVEEELENLEETLLTSTATSQIGIKIQHYRREYLAMKRGVYPIKDQFSYLLRSAKLARKEMQPYLNDVSDHLNFALQTIETCRELLSSLVDLYISNNDLRMNDIMKRLTIVSTIFIPLTFLVGVWGMNFKIMPELDWQYGYLVAWLVMIVIGLLVYLYFKRKKWY